MIGGPRISHLFPCGLFVFNDPAPPDIYPLPLHAALPISLPPALSPLGRGEGGEWALLRLPHATTARRRHRSRTPLMQNGVSRAAFARRRAADCQWPV